MGVFGMLYARALLIMMRTPLEYLEDALRYMQVFSAGIVAVAAYNTISAMLQALVDSKTPLLFLILSSILNVILDLIFVLMFKWGVTGVAVATVLSQLVSSILCVVYAMRKIFIFKYQISLS